MPRATTLLLCLFTLAGCGSIAEVTPAPMPRPRERPLRAPAAPTGTAEPAAATPTAHPVTLDEAIEEALAQAPELLAAAEAVNQARGDYVTASLLPNPQLLVDGTTQSWPGKPFNARGTGGPPEYDAFVQQPLDALVFGKRSAAIESARRGVDVAGADLADVRRRRAGDVAAAFFDLLEARAVLDLARTDLENLRRVEALTGRRVELGGSAAIDLDRARLAAATSRQDLRAAEAALAGAVATLRALVGRAGAEPGFDVRGSLDVAAPREPPDLEPVLEIAEEARPDLVSLRRQVEKAEADVVTANRAALPALSLELGFSLQRQEAALDAHDATSWDFAVMSTLPIFDRNQGNIARSESLARQARHQLEAGRVALRAELAQALVAFSAAEASVGADDPAQLEAARSVRERTEAAYRAGGRTILELLDAERAFRDAMRLHVHARSAYWHALHRLNAAAGMEVVK